MFSKPKHPGCKCGTKYKKYILCCKILMTILFLQSLWAKKKKRLTKKSRTERLCETTKSVGKQLGMQLVEIGFSSSFSLTNLNMLKVSIHEFLPQIHYVQCSHTYVHVPWSISYGFFKSLPGISNVQEELPLVWIKALGD